MCKHDWRPRPDHLSWRCARCGGSVTAKELNSLPAHERHEFWSGRLSLDGRLQPTRNTWVSKDRDGVLKRVNVSDMSSGHIARWVRMFRDKFADGRDWRNDKVQCAEVDSIIVTRMVTGEAILHELERRNMEYVPAMEPMPTPATASTLPGPVTVEAQAKAATIPLPLSTRQRRQRKPDDPPVPPGFRHIELGDD